MIFESKFGIGEICIYGGDRNHSGSRMRRDHFVKIVAVIFQPDGLVEYMAELSTSEGIQRLSLHENHLEGDPEFNQETGKYPEDF